MEKVKKFFMRDIGEKVKDEERWEVLKFVLCVFACIPLLGTLVFFQYGFYLFHISPTSYEIREVPIVREETEVVTVPGPRGSHRDREIPIYRAFVEYEVQGTKFSGTVFCAKDEKQGDKIRIAIKKKEPEKIMRPDFLQLSSSEIDLNVFCALILFIVELFDLIAVYKERKKGHVISITTNDWKK